jgi:hypothetical protein
MCGIHVVRDLGLRSLLWAGKREVENLEDASEEFVED